MSYHMKRWGANKTHIKDKKMVEEDKLVVGITRDFIRTTGDLYFDPAAYDALTSEPRLDVHIMEDPAPTTITEDHVARFDCIIMKRSPLGAAALEGLNQRLLLVARNGVGYDHLDVAACTRAGVMVVVTPEAVQRPVASSIMAFILALAHRLSEKDRMTRTGRWAERNSILGIGLSGKTLGMIGVGNIGAEVFRLAMPWNMIHLGCDPHVSPDDPSDLHVRWVDMDTLLKTADFVCLCCPYNDQTRRMIGAREFGLMKPTAYFINTARGEIVDEAALIETLAANRIAGAAVDVFEKEPPLPDNPLFQLHNVIVTSHNISLSEEGSRTGNKAVAAAAISIARGQAPKNIINPQVLNHPRLRKILTD